jgi:DNA polymerase
MVDELKRAVLTYRDMGMEPPPVRRRNAVVGQKAAPATQYPMTEEAASLEHLREIIGDCRRCRLWNGRGHLVFGEGSPNAALMFVGEGPGREEDAVGRPFVGEAGRLLTRIIENGMGLSS